MKLTCQKGNQPVWRYLVLWSVDMSAKITQCFQTLAYYSPLKSLFKLFFSCSFLLCHEILILHIFFISIYLLCSFVRSHTIVSTKILFIPHSQQWLIVTFLWVISTPLWVHSVVEPAYKGLSISNWKACTSLSFNISLFLS